MDYDDEEADREAVLRELALVVRAYLRDGGRVELRRGLIRSHPVLDIDIDGHEWALRGPLFRSRRPNRSGRAGVARLLAGQTP